MRVVCFAFSLLVSSLVCWVLLGFFLGCGSCLLVWMFLSFVWWGGGFCSGLVVLCLLFLCAFLGGLFIGFDLVVGIFCRSFCFCFIGLVCVLVLCSCWFGFWGRRFIVRAVCYSVV